MCTMGDVVMKKFSKKVRKMLILPCICSVAFYMGSQVVTYTEASFSNQQTVQSDLSVAIVFPKTIEKLTEEAKKHKDAIFTQYNVINSAVNSKGTVAELENKLARWKQHREVIKAEITAVQSIYTEIESYYNEVVEDIKVNNRESAQEVLKYVQAGFTQIQSIRNDIDKQAVLQKVDEHIQVLEKQINEEKMKQTNEAKKQTPVQPKASSQPEQQSSKQEEKKQENNADVEQQKQIQEDDLAPTQSEKSKEEVKQEASTAVETKQ